MANDEKHVIGDDQALVIGLTALGWTLGDGTRADRLLALTGLDADQLRRSATDPAMLAGVIRFLEGHEPDLIACADALELKPDDMIAARNRLETQRHG